MTLNIYKANPISQVIIVALLSYTVLHTIPTIFEMGIVCILSLMFMLAKKYKESFKLLVIYLFLILLPILPNIPNYPFLIKMCISVIIIYKMFYLTFIAAKYFVTTSDIGSILSSMDLIRVPQAISIPIAIIFRFFPAYKQEKYHIKQAMKIRGLTLAHPFSYFEYVFIPLLMISSSLADDIAKAAQTRCIENPIKKTRYFQIQFQMIDYIYIISIALCLIGGILWSN